MTETPEKFVERVREYAKAATSGPWECVPGGSVFCMHHDSERGKGCFILFDRCGYEGPECNLYGDGNFIANARTDLPAALSIIETLVRERDEARNEVKLLRAVIIAADKAADRHASNCGLYDCWKERAERTCDCATGILSAAVAAMKGA